MPARSNENGPPLPIGADVGRPRVCLVGTSGARTDELGDALHGAGAAVSGSTGSLPDKLDFDAVVVLLTKDLLAIHDEAALRSLVARCGDRLVLITSGVKPGAVLKELSQRPLDDGADIVARHVLDIARAGGGEALSALDRLRAEATLWDQGGRSTKALLRGLRSDKAIELISTSAGWSDVASDHVVREFVRASEATARRRERRLAALAALTAVALLSAGLVAVWQRGEARTAEAIALRAAGNAESQRLAQLAMDLADVDPDLPTLLAAQAFAAGDTLAAAEAARLALTATPQHQTFPVDGTPVFMATAVSGHVVALQRADGAVDILSTKDGQRLGTIVEVDGHPVNALLLSASGDALVIGRQALSPTVHRAPAWDAEPVDMPLSGAGPRFWVDDKHFVVVGDEGSFIVDIGTGERAPYHLDDPSGAMVASSTTGDVVILRDDEVVVFDDSGAERHRVTVNDAASLAVSQDGKFVLLGYTQGAPSELRLDENGEPTTVSGAFGATVRAIPGAFLVGSDNGRVSIVVAGTGSIQRSFPAHRGPVVGMGPLADDRYATVGADGLRVWQPPPEVSAYPLAPRIQISDQFYEREYGLTREAARDKISGDQSASQLTVTMGGHALVLDLETLQDLNSTSWGPLRRLHPSRRMGEVVIASNNFNIVQLFDVTRGEEVWTVRPAQPIPLGLVAVSPEGHAAAAISPIAMIIVSGADGTATTHPVGDGRTPVSLFVADEATATAVFSSGELVSSGQANSTRATPPGVGALAAGWTSSGEGVVAGGDDRLYRASTGTAVVSYPPGLAPLAVSVSDDGQLAAVIGRQRTVLLSMEDGEMLLDLPARTTARTSVRDAAVVGDDLVVVRGDGSVERWPIWSREDLPRLLEAAQPRELSDEDRQITLIGDR